MAAVLRELRLALRRLGREPRFTALAVIILALGLGAAVTMFSLVNAWCCGRCPIPRPIAWCGCIGRSTGKRSGPGIGGGVPGVPATGPGVRIGGGGSAWRDPVAGAARADAGVGVGRGRHRRFSGGAAGQAAPGPRVRAGGGTAGPRSGGDGEHPVLAGAASGGDPGIIGRQIRLDGEVHTIVGVLAPGVPAHAPAVGAGRHLAAARLHSRAARTGELVRCNVIARLQPGVTLAQADAQLRAAGRAARSGRRARSWAPSRGRSANASGTTPGVPPG